MIPAGSRLMWPRQATLATLKYTADERAGGWDTVQVSIGTGAQRGDVPLYIVRKAGGAVNGAGRISSCERCEDVGGTGGSTEGKPFFLDPKTTYSVCSCFVRA